MRRATGLLLGALLLSSPAEAFIWPNTAERIEKDLSAENPDLRRLAAARLLELPRAAARRLTVHALADSDDGVRLAAAQAAIRLRLGNAGELVVPWLNDSEQRIRLAAAEVLRFSPTPRAVAALGRVLSDPDSTVRHAAADALGESRASAAVVPLLSHLDDSVPQVRIAVVFALARLGEQRAVVPLIGKIQDSRPAVREAVAQALGDLGSQRASSALVLALRDESEDVRISALDALGRLKSASSLLAVMSLFEDDSRPRVRAASLAAMGRIAGPVALTKLIQALDSDGSSERAARRALGLAGRAAVPQLLECLVGQPSTRLANGCVAALAEIAPPGAPVAIVGALRRGIVGPRAALRALGRLEDSRGLPTVLEHLVDADPFVRAAAANAASVLLDPGQPDGRAVGPISRALEAARSSPSERAALVRLLGRTGSPRAAKTLIPLAKAADDIVLRGAAIEALGQLGSAGQDAALIEALDADEAAVRLAAAIALRRSGAGESAPKILERLSTAAEQDRAALAIALAGPMSKNKDARLLARTVEVLARTRGGDRDALLEAVGRMPGRASATRLHRLARSATEIADRAKVAESLAEHPEAVDYLEALASDVDGSVRANAAWSLGAVGTAKQIPSLLRSLKDPDAAVAGNAAASLGRIGVKRHVDVSKHLCAALSEPKGYVRVNALGGLRALGARCADGAPARQLLARDVSDQVRQSAAALISSVKSSAPSEDLRALTRCAAEDRSGAVAVACSKKSSKAPHGTEPVSVYVVPTGESAPAPRVPFALVRADGLVRLGLTDRRGAVFEHDAPRGFVSLGIPAPLAR